MKDMEQLSFWKKFQIRNIIWIKNPGSKTASKFDPNLFGVQTGLKKSDKFPKILICLSLLEHEFRLVWLYGEIWSFHPSFIWQFENNKKGVCNLNSN
jgi:hypothetical protein